MHHKQTGMSFIAFVIVLAVVGFFAFIAMQSVPAHSEYVAVQKVLKDTMAEVGPNASRPQYATAFDRRAQIDDIKSVVGADLKIAKEGGGTVLVAEYSKRQPLFAHVSLVFDFVAKSSAK
jgi:hypothetical protein